jgi:hypothetical protein
VGRGQLVGEEVEGGAQVVYAVADHSRQRVRRRWLGRGHDDVVTLSLGVRMKQQAVGPLPRPEPAAREILDLLQMIECPAHLDLKVEPGVFGHWDILPRAAV